MYRKRIKKTTTKPGRKKQKTIEDLAEVGEETPRAKRAAARNEVVVGEETPRAKRAAARETKAAAEAA